MFPTQTKTRTGDSSVTKLERRHLDLKSGLCYYPEKSCAYSEIVKTVRLIHLLSVFSRIEGRESADDVRFCRRVYNLSAAADVSAAFLEVPREDNFAKLSKDLVTALKMECNSEVGIKTSQ